MARYVPIIYRSNPKPLPHVTGPKVVDCQGYPTYESNIVVDDYGRRTDYRTDGYDRKKGDYPTPTLFCGDNDNGMNSLPRNPR